MKQKGILLPIFSLPSKYGIGDFGYEAYEFIDILSENKIEYWEILPINSSNKLPYSPTSYYALNEEYISLDKLKEMNLLDDIKVKEDTDRIVFDEFKQTYYKTAFSRFEKTNDYMNFIENKKIIEYAEFMNKRYNIEKDYTYFLQYILDKQWNELKSYANSKNVKIVGDMPIYPDFISSEVEYNKSYFELKDNEMEFISGAPPDEYNEDGQIWGTPVYNYENIKKDNYKYLIERYFEFSKRYDIVRIDHFIGYSVYYKIPKDKKPVDGKYSPGPSYEFFDKLLESYPIEKLWVEDLGVEKKEANDLRDNYNFIGQNITLFSINILNMTDKASNKEHIVTYTGNHDTDTIVGWYNSLTLEEKNKCKEFFKKNNIKNEKINLAFIEYCVKSKAEIIVVPVQDILGLDSSSRINFPGTTSSNNWSWKLKNLESFKKEICFFAEL